MVTFKAITFYQEHDKVMINETGEVLTVHEDLSPDIEPGIVVKENIGRTLQHCEVRPAGHTRQRAELAAWITLPDVPPPPPPENCVSLAEPEKFIEELMTRGMFSGKWDIKMR
jgi:hypothetical protein